MKICENLKEHGHTISDISREVLDWIYPFCKEAIDGGVDIEATEFIVEYYKKHVIKQRVDLTPIDEVVLPKKVVKTPSQKIQKHPNLDLIIQEDDVLYKRFFYLNTYRNENDLRMYCRTNGIIAIKPEYNKREIKKAIIEFYKDKPGQPPF